MSLILVDQTAATKTLDVTFAIKGMPWKKRSQLTTIAYRDGARNVADLKVDARTIQIEGVIRAASEAAYMTAINDCFLWLNKTDLKLYYTAGKYINVKEITDISQTFTDGGFLRITKLAFTCQCEDPFFYYDAASTDSQIIAATPTSWTITNAGSYEVYPVITITNSANNTSFTLDNETDYIQLQYNDVAFLNGCQLIIDSLEGTVVRDGTNTIDLFSGNFLKLLVGANAMKYTGANCTILTTWYRKEL